MFARFFRKVAVLTLGVTLTAASGSAGADDTEIYFSSASSSGNTGEAIRPNVLFILDTSFSMDAFVTGGSDRRIDVLKDAMTQVIEELEDVNLGLMRFTSDEGGPVLFPIAYIDESLLNVVGEATEDYENVITIGSNDAEEAINANTSLRFVDAGDSVLDFTNSGAFTTGSVGLTVSTASSGARDAEQAVSGGASVINNTSGLRFTSSQRYAGVIFAGVNIPQGAKITSANLVFTESGSNSSSGGPHNITIKGQNVDAPADFSTAGTNNISGRTLTSASVTWSPGTGTTEQTPDIKTIVQAIVCRGVTVATTQCPSVPYTGTWTANNNMAFILERTSGTRNFLSAETGTSSTRPKLNISYESAPVGTDLMLGIRFQDIRIPKGATVTSASLEFTPTASRSGAVTWTIKGHNSSNSSLIITSPNNLGARAQTTATATWDVPDWTAEDPIATTDTSSTNTLKGVIQEIVNRSTWCGGNSLTLLITAPAGTTNERLAYSYEGSPSKAPKLKYTYDAGANPTGCFGKSENSQAAVETDDAEQSGSVVDVSSLDLNIGLAGNTVGLRFPGVDIPQGATVLEATIEFVSKGVSTGAGTYTINGEFTDSAVQFSITPNDISARPLTTASVSWTPEDWSSDLLTSTTPDLTTIVQAIVNQGSWESGNHMGFVITPSSGAQRVANTYNSNPAKGPRLRIKYQGTAESEFKTVRERLLEVVDTLGPTDSTPGLETLFEAARYWRGEQVLYGKYRDSNATARISHPGSYCSRNSDNSLNCHGATVNATSPTVTNQYGQYIPTGCSTTNLDNSSCSSMELKGTPTYISPFHSELTCQNNYQVFLTDGAQNSGDDGGSALSSGTVGSLVVSSLNNNVACLANNSTFKETTDSAYTYRTGSGGGPSGQPAVYDKCSVEIVKKLKTSDQSTSLSGDQTVSTYTIGFDLANLSPSGEVTNAKQYMKDLANVGGGKYFDATSVEDLISVFQTILTDVKSDPTSFVSPSLATNAFNRLLSRDEVYFGLFTPSLNKAWLGNVKKYKICIDTSTGCSLGQILDAQDPPQPAIDSSDDKFKDTAQSLWSNSVDGKATTQGGSGAEITDYTQTVIYTDSSNGTSATSSTDLDATAGYKLTSTTWTNAAFSTMRSTICSPASTAGGSDCEKRMLWLLGKVSATDADNDISSTQRWSTNDVLHSSPAVITYGGEDGDNDGTSGEPEDADNEISTFFDKVFVGTNDGTLHMINGFDGKEDWRFLPQAFWSQQQTMYGNPEGTHPYGLDTTPTLLAIDVDRDGTIEPGDNDKVQVFVATRGGGKYIYSLDLTDSITSITDKVVPHFKWKIQGGSTTGYSRLAYTWSQPRLATISVRSGSTVVSKRVLVFGGGWDTSLSNADVFSPADNGGSDFLGNAIFIADPDTGEKLLSISGSGSGADIQLAAMHYSIPSRVTITDSDGDGVDDRLYVGDTGGQLWRVDLGSDIQSSGGLLAIASCTGTCKQTVVGRLAAVSDVNDEAKFRRFFEPPAVVQVRDAVYSDQADYDYVMIGSGYRDHPLDTEVEDRFYAFRDRTITRMTPVSSSYLASGYADGSSAPLDDGDLVDATDDPLDAEDNDVLEGDGWYYDFTSAGETGEKVMSAPTATAGGVTFTTFRPGAASVSNPCEGTLGSATAYNFNILSANAFLDWDGDGDIDRSDTSLELGGGIPSDVVPVFTEEGVVGIVGIEGGASQLGVLSGLPRFRTYWYENM